MYDIYVYNNIDVGISFSQLWWNDNKKKGTKKSNQHVNFQMIALHQIKM